MMMFRAQGIKAIELGLNEGKRGAVKPGTYKLEIRAVVRVADQRYTIKKSVLTVKLTEVGSAKVKLASPKGKINLIDRENTSVVYTPKVSGVESTVESVRWLEKMRSILQRHSMQTTRWR